MQLISFSYIWLQPVVKPKKVLIIVQIMDIVSTKGNPMFKSNNILYRLKSIDNEDEICHKFHQKW